MSHSSLYAISPVDGRYHAQSEPLRKYFSEFALFKYRVKVEIEYFIALSQLELPNFKAVPKDVAEKLRAIYLNFTEEDAISIKNIEKQTNHDIKAVEYFIKEKLQSAGLQDIKEWVHFGLTSQDINNTAIPLLTKEATENAFLPALQNLIDAIAKRSSEWRSVSMLARTHGQPASPTRLGKELYVFYERLSIQTEGLKKTVWAAKFGGATGNFNAHHVSFPNTDWIGFANKFISELGLCRSQTTTQIEHYDRLAAWCHNLIRINNILLDFCRDIWMYISMEYFRQKVKSGETGSSAMPHKVNPIDFENAEGNLGIANAMLDHFASKLPVSRLQRDLSDSTVLRNIGVPVAHNLIAIQSILKGLDKLLLNEEAIQDDLRKNTVVIAEAIQTILRREGYHQPYEALKELTRGKEKIDLPAIHLFIDGLMVSDAIKAELKTITPENYTGIISF